MKTRNWLITVPVKAAKGYQQFTVNAKSGEEAIEKFHAGEGEFCDQEIEVTDIGEPTAELNE